MDNIRHVRGRVVRKQQCVVGGELGDIGSIFIQLNIKYSACLEDVARGEAGEDEASHQLRVGDNHTVSADKVKVLTHDVWSACRSFKHWRVTESLAVKCQNQNARLGGFGVCPFIDSACGREFFICSWRHSVGYWGQSSALYQTGRESQLSPHGQSHSFVFRLSKKQDTSKRFR